MTPTPMAAAPFVSVVMAARNAEATLELALASVLTQTLTEFELIVVDDGSTDRTSEILRRATVQDVRVTAIGGAARGLTLALKKAVTEARGIYLARQDADDVSLPSRFERQVACLQNREDLAAVGTATILIDEHDRALGMLPMRHGPAAVRRDLLAMRSTPVHGSVMMRRDRYDTVGGYRDAFRTSQDFDLWLRLTESFEMDNLAEPLYRWRVNPAGVYGTQRGLQLRYSGVALVFAHERAASGTDSYELLEECDGDLDSFALRYRHRNRLEALWGEFAYRGLNDPAAARRHLAAALRLGYVHPRTLALWGWSLLGLSWPGSAPLGVSRQGARP